MTLQEFSQSINKFYEDGHDKSIKDLSSMLKIVRKYFLDCYDQIADSEFAAFRGYGVRPIDKKTSIREELVKKIRFLNKNIKGSSNPKVDFNAFKRLYEFFFDGGGNIRDNKMLFRVVANTDFYRMRSAEGYKVYDRKGIFQIGGEKRKLTSKLRFSDDGHPCLYLGSSLYIAWEEVRRAPFDMVNFARFCNTRKLDVLDLTVRPRCANLTDFVMSYLCLLTSAKVEDDDKYKYRYEVSGLLMKLLQNSIAHKGNVDGIKYVSSRQFDGKDIDILDRNVMIAYVFPPKQSADKGPDQWLKDTFKVSAVRTSFHYNVHLVNLNSRIAHTSGYQQTLFYNIEQQLKSETLEMI